MKKLILFLLFIWWPLSSAALQVSSLYQVEISIASQTEDIKEQAIQDGFSQVLLKVSGDPNILNNPLVRINLGRADYYVQDYSYSKTSTNSSLYTIVINFSEPDVRRLLKKAGEQYWGDNRPLLLVWLAITDKDNNTLIIDSESGNDVFTKMSRLGKRVGLPIMFPMMDMDDLNQVSSDDVATMSLNSLNVASKRYAPDGLLIGYIKYSDNSYDADWQLIVGKNQWKWSMADANVDGLTEGIINLVSQTLAKFYIVKPDAKTVSLKMNVTKINQGKDLAQLVHAIKQITSVKQVELAEIIGDQVVLSILTRGNMDSFQQNMAINQKLVLKSQDSLKNKLFYEWAH